MTYSESQWGNASSLPASMATPDERGHFLRMTYLHLAGAIGLFAMIQVAIFNLVPRETLVNLVAPFTGGMWLVLLGGVMLISVVARRMADGASQGVQYAGLALYVVGQSVIFVPLLLIASLYAPGVIATAGVITGLMFVALTAFVFLTRTDFSFLRGALLVATFAALGLIVCGALFGFDLTIFFTVFMIALAVGYILYDTSNVMNHYAPTQYVAASVALFASVALLFWYVIQLLMRLRSE